MDDEDELRLLLGNIERKIDDLEDARLESCDLLSKLENAIEEAKNFDQSLVVKAVSLKDRCDAALKAGPPCQALSTEQENEILAVLFEMSKLLPNMLYKGNFSRLNANASALAEIRLLQKKTSLLIVKSSLLFFLSIIFSLLGCERFRQGCLGDRPRLQN